MMMVAASAGALPQLPRPKRSQKGSLRLRQGLSRMRQRWPLPVASLLCTLWKKRKARSVAFDNLGCAVVDYFEGDNWRAGSREARAGVLQRACCRPKAPRLPARRLARGSEPRRAQRGAHARGLPPGTPAHLARGRRDSALQCLCPAPAWVRPESGSEPGRCERQCSRCGLRRR